MVKPAVHFLAISAAMGPDFKVMLKFTVWITKHLIYDVTVSFQWHENVLLGNFGVYLHKLMF